MNLSSAIRILFLTLTIVFFKSPVLYAQANSILAIDSFCNRIDQDTTIKWKSISKDILQKNNLCACDDFTYHSKNDTIFKATTYVLHVSIKSDKYYFKDNKLVLVVSTNRYDNDIVNETKYYYNKDKLLTTILVKGSKAKDVKELAKYFLENAQTYLNFSFPKNE